MKKFIILSALGLSFFASSEMNEKLVLLTDQEKSDLLFLREEEKLARDVYIYSYNKYNMNIFSNISNSEQHHMSNVLNLLNKYGLADPITNNAPGVFSNSELQTLYNQLTNTCDVSLNKALEVGANIEYLDIKDINKFKSHTSNSDLLDVYDKLTCGSRNHMRAFVRQLGTYKPIYISQTEFNSIINSSKEQCGRQ